MELGEGGAGEGWATGSLWSEHRSLGSDRERGCGGGQRGGHLWSDWAIITHPWCRAVPCDSPTPPGLPTAQEQRRREGSKNPTTQGLTNGAKQDLPSSPPAGTESLFFLLQRQRQARPLLLGAASLTCAASLLSTLGSISIFKVLTPVHILSWDCLFLEALAPSTCLLSPQPRLPGVRLQSTSVWGRARKPGHTPFTGPSLSVPGMS